MTDTDNTEIKEPHGPRRYVVKMDVNPDKVGPIFSALISETEQPTLIPGSDGQHRIIVVCFKDQLNTIIPLINDQCNRLFVGPYNSEAKPTAPAQFRPLKPIYVPSAVERDMRAQQIPMKRTRVAGGAATRDTAAGRVVMSVFKDKMINHPADFVEALEKAGFSGNSYSAVVHRLVQEGDLVRIGQGAYRVPTSGTTPG